MNEQTPTPTPTPTKRFARVKEIPHLYPSFSESNIRYYILHAKRTGFEKCIRKIDRRILINLDDFEEWIDSSKK